MTHKNDDHIEWDEKKDSHLIRKALNQGWIKDLQIGTYEEFREIMKNFAKNPRKPGTREHRLSVETYLKMIHEQLQPKEHENETQSPNQMLDTLDDILKKKKEAEDEPD